MTTLVALPRLTVDELRVLLRAIQERVVHANGDEREVLRSLATAVDEAILGLRPQREPEAYVPRSSPAPGRNRPKPWAGVPQRAIRRWAADNGIWVSPTGQVSADVIARYRRAHPDEPDADGERNDETNTV